MRWGKSNFFPHLLLGPFRAKYFSLFFNQLSFSRTYFFPYFLLALNGQKMLFLQFEICNTFY